MESHISLKMIMKLQVCIWTLCMSAIRQEGVISARMTGAGFGGCTVNIVDVSHIDSFINNVG